MFFSRPSWPAVRNGPEYLISRIDRRKEHEQCNDTYKRSAGPYFFGFLIVPRVVFPLVLPHLITGAALVEALVYLS